MPKPKKTARAETRPTFRDRIVGLVWVPAARFKKHPENWRTHPERQREAFGAVLAEVGIADAALAFIADDTARSDMLALPGRDERAAWLATYKGKFTLIDGHLRREMIAKQSIPTLVLDVTPDEARKALASHDAVTALAEAHAGRWRALVDAAPFDGSTVRAALESSLSRYAVALPPLPAAPPVDREPGTGDVPESNYREQHAVMVVCDGEAHQREVYDRLMALGYNCKVVVT